MPRLALAALSLLAFVGACLPAQDASPRRPPNVVLILADDLGVGELGCYGQSKIRTPNLDALARDGMRFTEAYAGSCVCAPSRCVLLTGQHTGHCQIRDNKELGGWERGNREGQQPLREKTMTLGRWLQGQGYKTAAIGKWGLGGPDSPGMPWIQGFDLFFGYLCQRQAHNYYPEHLWRNWQKVPLEGNVWQNQVGKRYAPDLMIDEALGFVRANKDAPFFVYFATPVPHAALQVPDDSLAEYAEAFGDQPYDGKKGYLAHDKPRAAYAAMVTRMDRDIGRLLALLDELQLRDDTLIVYAADHGLALGSHGLLGKQSVYECALGCPLLVAGPGVPHGETRALTYLLDLYPTLCEVAGVAPPAGLEGHSLAPLWRGAATGVRDTLFLAFENSQRAVRDARFKLVRYPHLDLEQLFDLQADPHELRDLRADPEHSATAAHLHGELGRWRAATGDPHPLRVAQLRPRELDLSGRARKPDQWQPDWIKAKYFAPAGR